jgi:hypothetical protein
MGCGCGDGILGLGGFGGLFGGIGRGCGCDDGCGRRRDCDRFRFRRGCGDDCGCGCD